MSIKKTYEQIVKKIKEERVGYDNQIYVIERTLKSKENDQADLLLLSKNGAHAKEMALKELKTLEKDRLKVHRKRQAYIDQKKKIIDVKLEKITRKERQKQKESELRILERQDKENRKNILKNINMTMDVHKINEEIRIYKNYFKELKKLTGANDVNEII